MMDVLIGRYRNESKGGKSLSVTEENVVQQIKLKNEESITFLVDTYGGLVNAIIRKYLAGNQQDIEECFSDVLVAVWYHIESFSSEKNEFKQWIAAIAKYRSIDYVRKSEKARKHRAAFEFNENKLGRKDIRESVPDIAGLLKELNDTERAVLKSYYVEGISSKEIANQFNTKESWVHNKLSRGRKRLRTILLKGEV